MSEHENKHVLDVLKCLRSSSSSVVYKALLDVKNKILKSPEEVQMFKQNSGIQIIIRLVKQLNEKVLDLSLSILANLCVEDAVKIQVAEENGMVPHLLNIITHMQRDSIMGRTCRLIGNLATNQGIAQQLHHKGAVPKLTDIIKSKDASSSTKHMAVRALRFLWEVKTFRSDMIKDQAVRIVASLLTSKEDELLQAVLKALAKFTHCCNEQCALQVLGDGEGFEELLASMKVCTKSELVVGVVLNLCLIEKIRPILGTAGVVETIINHFSGQEPQHYSSDLVYVLCLLCRESVNRSKVRLGGGLELLLATLRCDNRPNVEAFVLNAMLNFFYDEPGLQVLIKEGLVPVLIKKLSKVVEDHGIGHKRQPKEKKNPSNSESSHALKQIRIDKETFSHENTGFRSQIGHWSPGSCRSVESFSPDAQRTYSPPPSSSGCSPSSASASSWTPSSPHSDAYSPVCSSDEEKEEISDDEGVAEVESVSDAETISPCLNDKEDMQEIQEALNALPPTNAGSRHDAAESWCLLILSRVSFMDILVDDMVSPSSIDTMLQYYALVEPPHSRMARILQRLTRNYLCLLPLLRAGFVLKVNASLTDQIHEDCSRCSDLDNFGKALLSQLSLLAESGYGEGEIFYQLLRAARPIQTNLILSVPFIMRTKRLLCIMMNCDQSGLNLLLELVSDVYEDGLVREAIECITQLAHILGLQPSAKQSTRKVCDCSRELTEQLTGEIIVLDLDDGASVCCKRDELCRGSPVFSAMLSGAFRESGRQRVLIQDVRERTLKILLMLQNKSGCCQCLLNCSDIDFAFEVLKIADRFIMQKVVNKIQEWLLEQLAPDIAPAIYFKAQDLRHVISFCEKMFNETLKFVLTTKLDKRRRFLMFSAILNSDYKQQFLEDVSNLVKAHLDKT